MSPDDLAKAMGAIPAGSSAAALVSKDQAEMMALVRDLDAAATRAAWLAAYLSRRMPGNDQGDENACDAAEHAARRVRRALGYTNP